MLTSTAGCGKGSGLSRLFGGAPDSKGFPSSEPLGSGPPPVGAASLDPAVQGKTVLVVGDSWAGRLAEGMNAVASDRNRIVNGGMGGCGIMLPSTQSGKPPLAACLRWPTQWRLDMNVFKPDAVLLRTGNWDLEPAAFDGIATEVDITDKRFRKRFETQTARAIDILTAHGTPVYLTNVRIAEGEYQEKSIAMNNVMRAIAVRNKGKGVHLLNLARQLCDDSGCPQEKDGHRMYDETQHPSKWSRERLATWVLNAMFARRSVPSAPAGSADPAGNPARSGAPAR
ncbi:DUF459 domain-containing protein [Streptomyces melanogenes]|uniref:DUF459 domain-containing protein n=1 Tax=Streptomyces melanogenes TaxID=67326 RepID=UPI00167CC0B0|nr:SGNH hydrolase domain-containing protein [Streptomyces melanogenes]